MSASGFTPISLYYSTTASAVPTAANLVPGELAINTADGKLYYEDSAGVVQVLATKSTGSIGGSNTQVQFNNSGSLGGSSGLTWDGSFLTTSSIKNSALTSGRVTYAGASGLLSDSAALTFDGTSLTTPRLVLGGTTLPSAGAATLFSRTSDNNTYLQTGSGNNFNLLDGSQNTMATFSPTVLNFNISNTERMRLNSTGLGIGTSSPSYSLDLSSTTNGIIARFKSTSTYGQVVADNSSGTGGGLFVTKQNGTNTAIFGNSGGILGTTSTDVGIYGAVAGSSINFYNDDTPILKMTLNSSGNLGLGVTPSAWAATNPIKAIQVGRGGSISYSNDSASTNIVAGAYLSATNQWTKIGTVAAAKLALSDYDGSFLWSRAASGSGNFTYTDVMTLDASGNLLVGDTSVIGSGKLSIKSDNSVAMKGVTSTSGGNIVMYRADTSARIWEITANSSNFFIANGDFTSYAYLAATPTVWLFASDRRIKTDIVDIEYGLNAVMAMKPRKYKMLASGETNIGFVAQELKTVVPEAVAGEEIEYLDTDTPQEKAAKTMGVSKDTLIPVLVKAIQEQQALIESLTTRLTALENK